MRKNYWIVLALVFILPAMLFTVSCAKKAVKVEEPPVAETQPVVDDQAAKEEMGENHLTLELDFFIADELGDVPFPFAHIFPSAVLIPETTWAARLEFLLLLPC